MAVPNAALRFRPPASLAGSDAAPDAGKRSRGASGRPATGDAGDSRTVWVVRAGTPQPVLLRTGLTDGTVTEVVSGDVHDGDAAVVETISADAAPSATAGGGAPSLRRMF